jgi:hypothetical protein
MVCAHVGRLVSEQPTYEHTLDDLTPKNGQKIIFIFILEFSF